MKEEEESVKREAAAAKTEEKPVAEPEEENEDNIFTLVKNALIDNEVENKLAEGIVDEAKRSLKEDLKKFEDEWKVCFPEVRLITLYSPYRSIVQPLTKFIDKVEHKAVEKNRPAFMKNKNIPDNQ